MELKKYIEDQLQFCGNEALKSTCQIFYKASAIGSGVFIVIEGFFYLISAAHVLKPLDIENMTIPNGEILVNIQGKLVVTKVPINEGVDDKIDLAIVQLTEGCAFEIKKRFHFLTNDKIDFRHVPLESHQYMYCGYPTSTTEINPMEMVINPIPLKVRTKLNSGRLLLAPDYEKGTKWVLDYDREKQINIEQQQQEVSPHPRGVSGAGLWVIPCKPEHPIEDTNMKLIGIMTDYFEMGDKVVCATNIRLILEIIKLQFNNFNSNDRSTY